MKTFRHNTAVKINNGFIAEALADIRSKMAGAKFASEVFLRDLRNLEQRYFYMLRFLASNKPTAETEADYDSFIEDCRTFLDCICRASEVAESSSLYSSQVRYFDMRPEENMQTLVVDYITESARLRMDPDALIDTGRFRERERLCSDIFKCIWTRFPLTAEDKTTLSDLLGDRTIPSGHREVWVSAITLGLMEYFDIARLELLAEVYTGSGDDRLRAAALTGFLLGLFRFRSRRPSARLKELVASLSEREPKWKDDVVTVFLELVRSRDTERITKKMRDEIMPDMMKFGSKIMDRLQTDGETPESFAANPEWEQMMSSEGVFNKMKEMNDLQMEGSDLFMSTFGNMRTFPFFNDLSNWFLPFDPEHSSLSGLADGDGAAIVESFTAIGLFCDSDKYAMLLALNSTPSAVRRQAIEQISGQYSSMSDELGKDALKQLSGDDGTLRVHANNYIKNIYRFFKLFRRKNEFFDPFAKKISPVGIPLVEALFDDENSRRVLAEFFFRHEIYDEAAPLLSRTAVESNDATTFQRCAYAYEKSGNISEALTYYRQSLDLRPDSSWTLQRLAHCLTLSGDYSAAAATYERLLKLSPDDMSVMTRYGLALIQNEEYDKAIDMLSRVDYEQGGTDLRNRRALAWALMMAHKYDEAQMYYEQILQDTHSWNDKFNYAHLILARHGISAALDLYSSLVKSPKGTGELEDFKNKFYEDADMLSHIGVDSRTMARCMDALRYRLLPNDFGTI